MSKYAAFRHIQSSYNATDRWFHVCTTESLSDAIHQCKLSLVGTVYVAEAVQISTAVFKISYRMPGETVSQVAGHVTILPLPPMDFLESEGSEP
jgi:hypothetical protein